MIYLITNHNSTYDYFKEKAFINISVLKDNDETFTFYKNWAAKKYIEDDLFIGFDKETNGLDAWINSSILDIIGDKEIQFVLHSPYTFVKRYLWYIKRKFTIIGHNIKFDIKFALTESGVRFNQVYDTMIAEQRLYMKSGFKFALEELLIRYLNVYPQSADKKIREEFIDCDIFKFKLEPRHIYYAAGDVEHLFEIKSKQQTYIDKYNMNFLLYNVEFPLIYVIALAEITGWDFNKKEWLKIYKENLEKKFKVECQLDDEVRRLRDASFGTSTSDNRKRIYMIGGKWDNRRKHNSIYDIFKTDGTTNTLDLFGDNMNINTLIGSKAKIAKKIDTNPNNINYESPDSIIEIFGRLEEPLLTTKEALVVPTFKKTGKIDKSVYRFSTGENAFTMYKEMMPNTRMKTFIDLLLKHRGLCNSVNNFGANFVNKLNPVTGKLHTIFRQANAVTGRMQSGGGKNEPDKYNAQNIPSKSEYAIRMRNCFVAPKGYSIGTHDYSGAELIVMCSLSQDLKLLEISKKDMHSYVAQAFWRNIFKYRAYKLIDEVKRIRFNNPNAKETEKVKIINDYIHKSKEYIVDKTTGDGKVRVDAKPLTFGTIYGMFAEKAAKSAKVAKEEGQIIIDTIKSLFPKVFAMVEESAKFAKINGYLVLNTRANSRMWFPTVLKVNKGVLDIKENFRQLSAEVNEARNGKIQGTQADAIKEASVDLQSYIDKYSLDVIILKWVHDEIVDRHPKYLDGKSEEWLEWIKQNPTGLTFIDDNNNKHTGLSFPAVKRLIMINTFNRYLTNVTIEVDYEVEPYWTK